MVLGAQLACCARDKAFEAVRAVRAAPERRDRKKGTLVPKTCPSFRDDGSVRYDANSFSLKRLDRVSLNMLHRRVVGQFVLSDFQRAYLRDRSWRLGGAELIRRGNTWYLCVTQSKAAPLPDEPCGWLGVDLGIINLATDSDGAVHSGSAIEQKRQQLRACIAYKAQQAGVRVVALDPRCTSQGCSVCGHTERANRLGRTEFCCVVCGHASPANYNAARNIERAAVNQPLVPPPGEEQAAAVTSAVLTMII